MTAMKGGRMLPGMGLPKVDGHEFQWHLSGQAWDCPWSAQQSRCKHGEMGRSG